MVVTLVVLIVSVGVMRMPVGVMVMIVTLMNAMGVMVRLMPVGRIVRMIVIVSGLWCTLPVFASDDGTPVGTKLAIHTSFALFGVVQPFQKSLDQQRMSIEIRRDRYPQFGMNGLMGGDRGVYLLDQPTGEEQIG